MQSYTATTAGFISRLSEARQLYRMHTEGVPGKVKAFLERMHRIERDVQQRTGTVLEDLDLLEIGPGQFQRYLRYFALKNRAVGIDLDMVVDELSIGGIIQMLRINGPVRTAKTVVRKAMGVDKRFNAEMARQLGVPRLPVPPVLQMNAEALTYADASFDFVFSCSTFEHLPNPARVIRESNRMLRPGGVAFHMVHLYTCDGGCHDPRIMSGHRGDLPLWSHLRPQYANRVRPNSYLNKIRLPEWENVFRQEIPHVEFDYVRPSGASVPSELLEIRRNGELGDYSDEELLTVELIAFWKKPLDEK